MPALNSANPNYETGNVATYKAGAAITANRLVKYDTTEGQVIQTTAITDIAIGVSLQTVASGEQVSIQTAGVAKLTASAAIALGAQVMPTASGAGKVSTSAGATARSVGIAETLADADLEIIKVRLDVPNLNGAANT